MEKIIIAIMVVSFLYKVYKNFKKEMDKAAERAKKVVESNQPPVLETYSEPEQLPEKLSKSFKYLREENQKPLSKKEDDKKVVYDYYNPEVPAAEVVENRKIHQPHNHQFDFPKKKGIVKPQFDLKQALIYDAVFRRPKY